MCKRFPEELYLKRLILCAEGLIYFLFTAALLDKQFAVLLLV